MHEGLTPDERPGPREVPGAFVASPQRHTFVRASVEHRDELHDPRDTASTEEAIVATLAKAAWLAIAVMLAAALAHGAVELVAAL